MNTGKPDSGVLSSAGKASEPALGHLGFAGIHLTPLLLLRFISLF